VGDGLPDAAANESRSLQAQDREQVRHHSEIDNTQEEEEDEDSDVDDQEPLDAPRKVLPNTETGTRIPAVSPHKRRSLQGYQMRRGASRLASRLSSRLPGISTRRTASHLEAATLS